MSRYTTLRFLPILACAALAACSPGKSIPRDCLGRPIDPAHPPTGSASLNWQPAAEAAAEPALSAVAGYRIYYGIKPDQLLCQFEVPGPAASGGTVTGLSPGTWYFAVVSFDSASVESEPSAVVSKRVE